MEMALVYRHGTPKWREYRVKQGEKHGCRAPQVFLTVYSGKWRPACLKSHTGVLSTCSPRAQRTMRSFFSTIVASAAGARRREARPDRPPAAAPAAPRRGAFLGETEPETSPLARFRGRYPTGAKAEAEPAAAIRINAADRSILAQGQTCAPKCDEFSVVAGFDQAGQIPLP